MPPFWQKWERWHGAGQQVLFGSLARQSVRVGISFRLWAPWLKCRISGCCSSGAALSRVRQLAPRQTAARRQHRPAQHQRRGHDAHFRQIFLRVVSGAAPRNSKNCNRRKQVWLFAYGLSDCVTRWNTLIRVPCRWVCCKATLHDRWSRIVTTYHDEPHSWYLQGTSLW
jgi:hypothetical protein